MKTRLMVGLFFGLTTLLVNRLSADAPTTNVPKPDVEASAPAPVPVAHPTVRPGAMTAPAPIPPTTPIAPAKKRKHFHSKKEAANPATAQENAKR